MDRMGRENSCVRSTGRSCVAGAMVRLGTYGGSLGVSLVPDGEMRWSALEPEAYTSVSRHPFYQKMST